MKKETEMFNIDVDIISTSVCLNLLLQEKMQLIKMRMSGQNKNIGIRNRKTVWKHGPNRPFYGFMLRTKLY